MREWPEGNFTHAVIGRAQPRAVPVGKGKNSLWMDCRKPAAATVEKTGIACV
jgi:hypothetical protein